MNSTISFQRFMEALVRSSKYEVTAKETIKKAKNSRYSLKDIVVRTLDNCKKIPSPVKTILKDKLFYISTIRTR